MFARSLWRRGRRRGTYKIPRWEEVNRIAIHMRLLRFVGLRFAGDRRADSFNPATGVADKLARCRDRAHTGRLAAAMDSPSPSCKPTPKARSCGSDATAANIKGIRPRLVNTTGIRPQHGCYTIWAFIPQRPKRSCSANANTPVFNDGPLCIRRSPRHPPSALRAIRWISAPSHPHGEFPTAWGVCERGDSPRQIPQHLPESRSALGTRSRHDETHSPHRSWAAARAVSGPRAVGD